MTRFSIRQVGDRLILSLPRPKSRTDGAPLGSDARIELLMTLTDPAPKRPREIELAPALTWTIPHGQWSDYAQGQRIDVTLPLDRIAAGLALATGASALKGRKLSFIAEVVEGKRERSEPSSIESFVVCEPPPSPLAATGRITQEGILLDWKPGAPGSAAPAAAAASAAGPAPGGVQASAAPGARFGIYRQQESEPRPEAAVASVTADDAWLDKDAVIGATYTYLIRQSAAAGHCESGDSPPVVATRVDLFPPAPPEGLAAVAEHGTIRLFWRPGRESDLRGYRVYRADGPDKPWRLLTQADLTATSYTDEDVTPGVVYSYSVTARDGADPVNESARSDPAAETLKPSDAGGKP